MYRYFAFMYVYRPGAAGGKKRDSFPGKRIMAVSCHLGTENRSQVLWKSSQGSWSVSHISSPISLLKSAASVWEHRSSEIQDVSKLGHFTDFRTVFSSLGCLEVSKWSTIGYFLFLLDLICTENPSRNTCFILSLSVIAGVY